MAEFSEMVNQFSASIYQNVAEGNDKNPKNLILSPLSIQTALSLAFLGSKTETAEEMATVMKFGNLSRIEVAAHFQTFLKTLQSDSSVTLANKIFVHKDYVVKKEFNEIATKQFYSEVENINFSEAARAADNINNWVESKTNKKITNLADKSMFDKLTRMVLVNAIHFKGLWVHQFEPKLTVPTPFWLNQREKIEVQMMHNKARYNFAVFDELDCAGIELPYRDSNNTMFILLPNRRNGLAKLEANLENVNLKDLSKKLWKQEVFVSLPKFKVEFQTSLKDTLKKMGLGRIFSNDADFSDLLDSPEPLFVSDIIHKAFIEVNEEGAEAAAATFLLKGGGPPMPPCYFKADHPFYYILKDKNTVYFVGRTLSF